MRFFLVLMVTVFLTGCVILPVSRTYFEPNIVDGQAERSSSCGYSRTAYDSLVRDVDGMNIHIIPNYREGHFVAVTILFQYPSGDMTVQPEEFELKSLSDGRTFKPTDVNRHGWGPDKPHPYLTTSFYVTYPVMSETLEGIELIFPAGTIIRNGLTVNLAPFRFNKVTKFDIYYGSINC
jgi:hypothetical protein